MTRYFAGGAGGSLRDANADLAVACCGYHSFVVDGVMVDCIQKLFPFTFSSCKDTYIFPFMIEIHNKSCNM